MNKLTNRLANIAEFILAIMFIQGGVRVMFAQPLLLDGPLSYLTGGFALITYALMWIGIGVVLLFAKWKRHNKIHKHALFAMFATCTYVLVLSVAITGIQTGQILTVVVGLVAGACWLNWKIKTEYVEYEQLTDEY